MLTTLEQLKDDYDCKTLQTKIARKHFQTCKQELKEVNQLLARAKKVTNKSYKKWVESRVEERRAKQRWRSVHYRTRQWTKEHPGKVLDAMFK